MFYLATRYSLLASSKISRKSLVNSADNDDVENVMGSKKKLLQKTMTQMMMMRRMIVIKMIMKKNQMEEKAS